MTHNPEHKPHKINNALLGVVAIFAIFLIVYFAIAFKANNLTTVTQNVDYTGQASQVFVAQDVMFCKLLVGQTTLYDDTTLAVTLETGGATYYSGYSVSVVSINKDGCVVDISGTSDYIAKGQIQRLGSLYITVKDVLQ
jgi:hypothetical protein